MGVFALLPFFFLLLSEFSLIQKYESLEKLSNKIGSCFRPQPPFHTELKDQCSGDMNDSSAHTKVWKEMLRGCVIDSNGIQTTELDSSTFLPLERRESNVPIQCLSNHNSINSSDDFEYQLTSLLQQIPKLPESSESSPHSTCHRYDYPSRFSDRKKEKI